MSSIRYLLDENVDVVYQAQLLRREPARVVWRVGTPGTPARGTPDPEILAWCELDSFILVTNNRRSMPVHLRKHLELGHHAPGIFLLSPAMSVGELIEELVLIWSASTGTEFVDQIVFLPVSS